MSAATVSRRTTAGFWSSARSFYLPVGPRIEPGGVAGYPIDLRVKADTELSPMDRMTRLGGLHVDRTQYGLGCYERWLAGDGEEWLENASIAARYLVSIQDPDGSWYHADSLRHTFRLPPPWASGITQGQGASLFVRLYLKTGEEAFAAAARLALKPLFVAQGDGGVRGDLAGAPWPEEYPTEPQSHVLNGAIFAIWGMRDVAVGLGDAPAETEFATAVDALASNLHRYDLGYWSLYSLYPHPVRNRASSFYHGLHVNQLTAMQQLAPRPEFERMRARWARYADSRACRARSFAWKGAFRLLVPRNRLLAHRLPWNRA